MDDRQAIGRAGELQVARYLQERDFTILEQNFRQRDGEVDIIARKNNLALFVEVKTRKNPSVDPAEVVTRAKQRKIIRAAHIFIARNLSEDMTYRFDVALVSFVGTKPTIAYIENAFQVEDHV